MAEIIYRYDPPPRGLRAYGGSSELFSEDGKSLICGTDKIVLKRLSEHIASAIDQGDTVKIIKYVPK